MRQGHHRVTVSDMNGETGVRPRNGDTARSGIFRPGHNCWRVADADRIACLIDGEEYFFTLHAALTQAQNQILIVGWDIAPNLNLLPHTSAGEWPIRLRQLLETLIDRRPQLEIYVLIWEAAILSAPLPLLPAPRQRWRPRRRLHFHLDDSHPFGASHHQKIVVIDDRLAFCGGLDITQGRWDTPRHRPDLRPGCGRRTRAYHDVQLAVDGSAAGALGDLARRRWRAATGRACPKPSLSRENMDPWPRGLVPDLCGAQVAIARTAPAWGSNSSPVREIETMYLDMISAARHSIYIENQFFTSELIAASLARRLADADGPEVVLVMPLETEGWVSRVTLDAMRGRMIEQLRRADRHHRFRVYYPHIPGAPLPVNLHSKVMVVDDTLLRVGSANINNRSMGLDTECDVIIDTACSDDAEEARQACGGLRDRLLAEHLDVEPERVRAAISDRGSLIGAIETLRGAGRSLRPLPYSVTPGAADYLQSGTEILDPGSPLATEVVMRELVAAREVRTHTRRRIAWRIGAVVLIIVAAMAWRWTPLGNWLETDTLLAAMTEIRAMPMTPALVLLGYLLASLIAVPITLMILATFLSFGTVAGLGYAFAGSMIGALAGYAVGHLAGRDLVRRIAGGRIDAISRRVASQGVLAIVIVRCIPVAPFTIINMIAGASHIRLGQYLIGTSLGMAPGMLAIALFTDRIIASVQKPTPVNYLLLAVVVLFIALAAWLASRWLRRRDIEQRTRDAGAIAGDQR